MVEGAEDAEEGNEGLFNIVRDREVSREFEVTEGRGIGLLDGLELGYGEESGGDSHDVVDIGD
jgi:hypothetical protein